MRNTFVSTPGNEDEVLVLWVTEVQLLFCLNTQNTWNKVDSFEIHEMDTELDQEGKKLVAYI